MHRHADVTTPEPTQPTPTFQLMLALLVLGLSLLYALTFSHLVHVSVVEQVIAPDFHPPRYAHPPHAHNAAEWVLLLGPAALGWAGVVGSMNYLARRVRRPG